MTAREAGSIRYISGPPRLAFRTPNAVDDPLYTGIHQSPHRRVAGQRSNGADVAQATPGSRLGRHAVAGDCARGGTRVPAQSVTTGDGVTAPLGRRAAPASVAYDWLTERGEEPAEGPCGRGGEREARRGPNATQAEPIRTGRGAPDLVVSYVPPSFGTRSGLFHWRPSLSTPSSSSCSPACSARSIR